MIYIDVLNYSWYLPGKYASMENLVAWEFVQRVQLAIGYEEYKARWRSLSWKYRKYKEENELSPKMWEATGALKNDLYVDSHNRITFGERKHIRIARVLEYGSLRCPARPLFRPILAEMKAEMMREMERELANES